MPKLCFYLHLHQPNGLKEAQIFDVGRDEQDYFAATVDDNKTIFEKVAKKSYLPML